MKSVLYGNLQKRKKKGLRQHCARQSYFTGLR